MVSGVVIKIHVALLGEAVDVWRPVEAVQVSGGAFEIVGPSPCPDDEQWQFALGSLVRCREKVFSGGEVGLVAYEQVS